MIYDGRGTIADDLLFISSVFVNQSNSIFHLISSIDHAYRYIANEVSKLNIKDVQGVNTFERTQFLKYFGKKE